MKKIYLIMFICSFTATIFAQEKTKPIRENDIVESPKQVKIEQISKIAQNNATNAVVSYDFTTSATKYYGGIAACKVVAINGSDTTYAMIAGDSDGSGTVDAGDRSNTWNERNQSGYKDSDVDLSGTTDAGDRSITWNNRNKSTSVPE